MRRGTTTTLFALIGLLLCGPFVASGAEPDLRGLGDPTRPPASVLARQSTLGAGPASGSHAGSAPMAAEAPASAASAPASSASAASAPEAHTLRVSAIRIDLYTGVGVAVVGDDVVHVGDKVKDMTVVSITQEAVELKGPQGMRRLVLPDAIEQSQAKAGRAAKRGRKERK